MRKRKAELSQVERQGLRAPVDETVIERRASARGNPSAQSFGTDLRNMGLEVDTAEAIGFTLIDRKGQDKALDSRVIFGPCIGYADVSIAAVAVIAPKLILIGREPIRIINVSVGEKAQHVGRGRAYNGGKLALAESVIADEVDLPHRRLCAFGDRENEVDAVLAAADDFRHHPDIATANAAIGLHDATDIRLQRGTLKRSARLGLDDGREILVLDFLVAFEDDADKDPGLDQVHDHGLAGTIDLDLVEQFRRDQPLQRRIQRRGIVTAVWRSPEIGAYRLGIDPLVALNDDPGCRRICRSGIQSGKCQYGGGKQRLQVTRAATPPLISLSSSHRHVAPAWCLATRSNFPQRAKECRRQGLLQAGR